MREWAWLSALWALIGRKPVGPIEVGDTLVGRRHVWLNPGGSEYFLLELRDMATNLYYHII